MTENTKRPDDLVWASIERLFADHNLVSDRIELLSITAPPGHSSSDRVLRRTIDTLQMLAMVAESDPGHRLTTIVDAMFRAAFTGPDVGIQRWQADRLDLPYRERNEDKR